MKNFSVVLMTIAVTSLLSVAPVARAEINVQGGSGAGDCTMAVGWIVRRWSEVKQYMLPANAKLEERVKMEHFYCIAPYHVRNAIERNMAVSADLRCFMDPGGQGRGVCCDDRMMGCAQIHPGLVPESKRKKKKEKYQKSNSDWVRPPSDNDQWTPVNNN